MRAPVFPVLTLLACTVPPAGKPSEAEENGDSAAWTDNDWSPGPCDGGNYGAITYESYNSAIHVRTDGSDTADGSLATPVATLDAAMTIARASTGADHIAIGPGTFAANVSIGEVLGDENGLIIEGCGTSETTLAAAKAWDSILRVSGTQDVRLAGFTLSGGRRALMVYGGATAYLDSLAITASMRCGLLADGAATTVFGTSIGVYDTLPDTYDGDAYGYGILIQSAQFTMNDLVIDGSNSVGMLIDGTSIAELDDFDVNNTVAVDGFLGRGIQVQDSAQLTATRMRLSGNADAGLYARQALSVDLTDVSVGETALSNAPDGGASAGDGIVVTQGDTEHNYDPADFRAVLTNFDISGSARAGVLLDRVTGTLAGTMNIAASADDPGGGKVVVQGGAVVTGADVVDLDAAGTPLDTFGLGLDLDDTSDVGVEPE